MLIGTRVMQVLAAAVQLRSGAIAVPVHMILSVAPVRD